MMCEELKHKEWCAVSDVGCCTCRAEERLEMQNEIDRLRAENQRQQKALAAQQDKVIRLADENGSLRAKNQRLTAAISMFLTDHPEHAFEGNKLRAAIEGK